MPVSVTGSHKTGVANGASTCNILTIDGTEIRYDPTTVIGLKYLALAKALGL